MTISQRDRRALILLAVAAVLSVAYYLWPAAEVNVVSASALSVPVAEKRLAALRLVAATIPARQKVLGETTAMLKEREKGLIVAETAAQAQAQLVQVVARIARQQAPPVEIQQVENGPILPFGSAYGEVRISLTFRGAIEQLVNLLADLSRQPEIMATTELTTRSQDSKQKSISTRLTVAALIPKRLVPERKGLGAF